MKHTATQIRDEFASLVLARDVSAGSYHEYKLRKQQEGEKPLSEEEWRARVMPTEDDAWSEEKSQKIKAVKPFATKLERAFGGVPLSGPTRDDIKRVLKDMDKGTVKAPDLKQIAKDMDFDLGRASAKDKPKIKKIITLLNETAAELKTASKEAVVRNATQIRDEFATAVMVRNIVARFIAKQAMEHNSPEALAKYLKEHPNADKSKHTVKKPEKEEKGKADEGKKDKGGDDDKMVRPSSPKKSEELGGELSQWQGPGTPAINHVNSYLIGNHPVSKGKVREAIKELEQYKVDAKAKGWKGHEKDIDDTDVMIGKLRKLVGDPEPKKLPKAMYAAIMDEEGGE